MIRSLLVSLLFLSFASLAYARDAKDYFAIEITDADTGRGVPLVELRTTNDIRYYTDSNGLVAFDEPGLLGGKVFFAISSPGYASPVDGFGSKGVVLDCQPGNSAQVKLKRTNIAERLYRITGQGIYADTVRLGRKPPISQPVLNGRVMGQDSVQTVPYRGKIYWFWGDTGRPDYPLGNFGTSGATSPMQLDPSRGIDLTYFTDPKTGFSRPMVPLGKPGAVWIDGVTVVKDSSGRERMLAAFVRLKQLGQNLERGLLAFDDATQTFTPLPNGRGVLDLDARVCPRGHSFHARVDSVDYVYFAFPFPLLRVRADWEHATNPAAYEAFTCLKRGARLDLDHPALDRDAAGKLIYGWKAATDPIDPGEQERLIKSGHITREEAWINVRDVESKQPILAQGGSVAWNAYRKRWVMIFTQALSESSLLGEVWYAEADAPQGPWRFARKVATHPNYSFYNPCHHAFLDQAGGRVIYFEGTYTAEFSAAKEKTPRYNYNQLMYRLDLADPQLKLP